MQKIKNPTLKALKDACKAFRDEYRAIKTTRQGARYRAPIETTRESGWNYRPYDRLRAIALCRDLHRNSARVNSLLSTHNVLAFGNVKCQLNTENDEWNRLAESVFNWKFAEDCDYRSPDLHLVDLVQLVESAVLREGDILVVWGMDYVGKPQLLTWDADQICEVDEADWARQTDWVGIDPTDGQTKPLLQDGGIVTDFYGKEIAYIVTSARLADRPSTADRGKTAIPYREATVIPVANARLVRRRWRLNQGRGIPLLLPVSDLIADGNEMLKNELLTAKAFGKRGYFVEQSATSANAEKELAAEQLLARIAEIEGGEAQEQTEQVIEKKRYTTLEQSDASIVEYLDAGDKIVPVPTDRPNMDVAGFYDHVMDEAGSAFGLAQGYSRMRVNSSYTAHRGETNLTIGHIRSAQKRMERELLDWLAVKVIGYYVDTNYLPQPPQGWSWKISWVFPTIPNVDPQREISADAMALKTGLKTYRQLLGADWKGHLRELAEEIKFIKENGLPLNVLETVAGAIAENKENEDAQD